MGQQPNIELEMADLPRPTPVPAPPRRWAPKRPGELSSPEEVPWGGMYGTPGPDTGYVLRLLADEPLELGEHEKRADAVAAVAALAAARASRFGRAPTTADVGVAKVLLDYDGQPTTPEFIHARAAAVANVAHDATRAAALVGAVDPALLEETPDAVRSRRSSGEPLLTL